MFAMIGWSMVVSARLVCYDCLVNGRVCEVCLL